MQHPARFVAVLLGALLLLGCPPAGSDTDGSLVIVFGKTAARTIGPPLDTAIADFLITGSDGQGGSFAETAGAGAGSVTVHALAAGVWDITVDARNAAQTVVLSGSATAIVSASTPASVTVILQPPLGTGTLEFALSWPDVTDLVSPAVSSSLEDGEGLVSELAFTVDAGVRTAEYSGPWTSGYYTLSVRLTDGIRSWGQAYAVQVYPDAVSARSVVLAAGDFSSSGPGNATPGSVIWQTTLGSAFSSSVWSSPALGSDTLYVGADTGRLYALSLATGTVQWNQLTLERVTSSPAVAANGTVYFGSHDGSVYALNAAGSTAWSYPTPTGGWVRSSPALGSNGAVYVGSNDGYVYALDAANGTLLWSYNAGSAVTSSPSVGLDGTMYVGTFAGTIIALDPDGDLVWSHSAADWVHSSPAIDADGTVYVGSYDGVLYALAGDTGSVRWTYDAGDWIGSSPVIGPATLLEPSGRVYVGSRDGILHAVDAADGSPVWTFDAGVGGVYSTPAVDDDGVIYFGSYDRHVYAVDSSGTELWRYQTGLGGVVSSPALGPDGVLYVGGRNGVVYAFGTSSDGPAATPWPMFGRSRTRVADAAQ